jgi:hypothetical protein
VEEQIFFCEGLTLLEHVIFKIVNTYSDSYVIFRHMSFQRSPLCVGRIFQRHIFISLCNTFFCVKKRSNGRKLIPMWQFNVWNLLHSLYNHKYFMWIHCTYSVFINILSNVYYTRLSVLLVILKCSLLQNKRSCRYVSDKI